MEGFTFVTDIGGVGNGAMKTFTVAGKPIAVANVDGEFFAISDVCTHKQCSLGTEGALDGNVVICGCHGSTFDVMTGAVMKPPAVEAVKTYEVKVDAGKLYISV